MDKFEADIIGMVKEIKFRKMRNNIQQKMYEDMRRIRESDGIFERVGAKLPDDPLRWNFSRRIPTRNLS